MVSYLARRLWLLWCWLELSVFTLFLYLLSWLPRPLRRGWYHPLFRRWCAAFVRALGVRLYVHQLNARPLPRHFILIANHPSAFEDVGIPAVFDVYPLAKQEVRDWFLVGRMNMAADTLFVKREDPASRHRALEAMIARVARGDNIAIFPEGGCRGRRIYERFYTGAFETAMRTGVPILPVFLHYEAQETFEWREPYTLMQKFWHIMHSQNNRANFYVFDAVSPDGFDDKHAFAEYMRQRYLQWQARYLE